MNATSPFFEIGVTKPDFQEIEKEPNSNNKETTKKIYNLKRKYSEPSRYDFEYFLLLN